MMIVMYGDGNLPHRPGGIIAGAFISRWSSGTHKSSFPFIDGSPRRGSHSYE